MTLFSGKPNIIIVDDVEDTRVVFKSMLKRTFNINKILCDGEELLNYLEENPKEQNNIDVILLDLQMEKIDGLTQQKILRENEKYDNIKLIQVTQYNNTIDTDKLFEIGFDQIQGKPIDKKELINIINEILSK